MKWHQGACTGPAAVRAPRDTQSTAEAAEGRRALTWEMALAEAPSCKQKHRLSEAGPAAGPHTGPS